MLEKKYIILLALIIIGISYKGFEVFFRQVEWKPLVPMRSLAPLKPRRPLRPSFTQQKTSATYQSCLKNAFDEVLLVLIFNWVYYETVPMIKSNYEDAFPHIVVCGAEENKTYNIMVVAHEIGFLGYECVGKAIRLHPGFEGYLYLNDDMIVNWWNFLKLDRNKIWFGAALDTKHGYQPNTRPVSPQYRGWRWPAVIKCCEAAYREIVSKTKLNSTFANFMRNHHLNTVNKTLCLRGWSDMFYIPKRLGNEFQMLSAVFFKHKLFLSIAVTTMLSMLDLYENWEKPFGIYLPMKYNGAAAGQLNLWKEYSDNVTFIHPIKFKTSKYNKKLYKEIVVAASKNRTRC